MQFLLFSFGSKEPNKFFRKLISKFKKLNKKNTKIITQSIKQTRSSILADMFYKSRSPNQSTCSYQGK